MLDTGGYNGTNNHGSGLSGSFALNTQGLLARSMRIKPVCGLGRLCSIPRAALPLRRIPAKPVSEIPQASHSIPEIRILRQFRLCRFRWIRTRYRRRRWPQSGFSDSGGFGLDTRNQYASPLIPMRAALPIPEDFLLIPRMDRVQGDPHNLPNPHFTITDANFQYAVSLWFSDEANATSTYGQLGLECFAGDGHEIRLENRSSFNEDLSGWNVSSVTDFGSMFKNASAQPTLGDWNVSSATNLGSMFRGASSFDQPIGDWNISSVMSLATCLWSLYLQSASRRLECLRSDQHEGNVPFRFRLQSTDYLVECLFGDQYEQHVPECLFLQPAHIVNASVTLMSNVVRGFLLQSNIGSWNVSSVNNMDSMFQQASAFNQNIGNWNVSGVWNFEECSGEPNPSTKT